MEKETNCIDCSSRNNGVFKCVAISTLEELNKEKSTLKFKKKQMIFQENEKVTGFYCIKSGVVRTFKISSGGKEQTFHIAGRGKWLGFRDMISGDEYNHNSLCLEDVEVCFISKETVTKLIKIDVSFQIEIMKYLAEEWKEMENHIYSMGTKQIHSRLAELLLTFKAASGDEEEIGINVTREVMATCIGTTTESLIRALSDFKDRNWIKVEKNKISIVNAPALYHLSEQVV